MFCYHDTNENKKRLKEDKCRCASTGIVYNLTQFVQGGILIDPRNGVHPLSTARVRKSYSDPQPLDGGYGKTFIFAISKDLNLHSAPDSERSTPNSVKHETLFHNENVLAAGEIYIHLGIILDINDISGSYGTVGSLETNPAFSRSFLDAISKNNLPVAPLLLEQLENFAI